MVRGKKKPWLLNTNSRRWKQLDYVLDRMEGTFTVRDMRNWLSYYWETDGELDRHGNVRKQYSYHHSHVSRFLRYNSKVIIVGKSTANHNIYRHKMNKNEIRKTLP